MSKHPEMTKNRTLNASGLHCPQPIIRCRAILDGMGNGEVLHLITTDPGSVREIDLYIACSEHSLVASVRQGTEYHYYIEKRQLRRPVRPVRTLLPAGLFDSCLLAC